MATRHLHPATRLAVLTLCLAASACHRGHHHGSAVVTVHSFHEVEPNNVSWSANYVGSLAVGERVVIRGAIDDSGYDPFDGFAATTAEPMDVQFFLTADDPYADLDICYFDPYTGTEAACWETPYNPEAGILALHGGEDFHLVVSSYFGASTYTLELVGRPVGWSPQVGTAPVAPGSGGTSRERAVPFSAYGGEPEAALAPVEERAPAARGSLIAVDLETGATARLDFELGAQDPRAGDALSIEEDLPR